MRQYSQFEQSMQAAFEACMPLTPAQSGRLVQLCVAMIEAKDLALSKLARTLPHHTLQASRVRWIQRLLQAPFVTQAHLFQPLLQHALARFQARTWHLIIDRTRLPTDERHDLAMISLHYNCRAIPLVWQRVPKGGARKQVYCDLIERVSNLVPAEQAVVFHGDSEFGAAAIMSQLKQYGWDFILGVSAKDHLWDPQTQRSQALGSLSVPRRGTLQIPNVACFASKRIPVNVLAFQDPHHSGGKQRREVCYLVTTLPLDATTKRLGRRRWGTEPLFRDYKSAGWDLQQSYLGHPDRIEGLLVVLAICYVWLVTTGRWLSKVGRRREVDSHRRRHYSLFRLGWDWLVSTLKRGEPPPISLRLYT